MDLANTYGIRVCPRLKCADRDVESLKGVDYGDLTERALKALES